MIKHKSGTRWPDNREVGSRCVRSTPYIRRRGRWLVSGLASKPLGQFLLVWPQNRWVRVFQFVPENPQIRFGDLRVKITLTISCFGLQNQADYSLSVVLQYRREVEHGAGHALRSSGLLHLKASRARVSQSDLKTGGGMVRMVQVVSSHEHCIELKLKTDESMRRVASDLSIPTLPFSLY
jgi:hypothetical protein